MRGRTAVSFLGLAVAWGSAFTAIKAGLGAFPPILFAAFRYDFAGVLVLGYAVVATDRTRPRGRTEWAVVGVGGVFLIAAYHALLFVGEQGTSSAVAAIVVSLSPILTTGFARGLLPDERLGRVGLVGLCLGFAGVGVLMRPDPAALSTARTVSIGLILLATASFAFGSVLVRRIDHDLPIETMEAWSMLLGAVVLHASSVVVGESLAAVRWTPTAIGALSYLVVVSSAVGFLLYFQLLDRLGPIEINLVSYAAPIVATVSGVVLLGEQPSVHTVAGFLCILWGFGLLKRSALQEEYARLRVGLERVTIRGVDRSVLGW
jgi:drug/metabolite transporter (DMT)-like permease